MEIKTASLAVWHGTPVTVSACSGDRITVTDMKGGTKTVRPKDIEVIHPGPYKGGEIVVLPTPDWQETIDLVAGETVDFVEWVELAWGEWSPEAAWSGFLVLQEKFYWEGSVLTGVKARTPEEIAAVLAKKQAKEAKKESFNALVKRIGEGCILPEDELPMREIVAVARAEREKSALLEVLNIESSPRQAHRLLLRCGAVDDTFNPHPARYKTGYPFEAEELLETDGVFAGEAGGFPETAVAIDAAGSKDPDDAISPEADGTLWVHVADPADLIPDCSEVDREAMLRGVTLYLPEGNVPMLPGNTIDFCGLGLREKNRALSFHIGFNDDGSVFLKTFLRTEIAVTRMTYAEAETLAADPCWEKTLENLERYERYRKANGGIELILPEVDIHVDTSANSIELQEVHDDFGHRVVRNAMVAAGNAVGCWAEEHDLPMPFAVQSFAEDAPEWGEFGGSWVESFERRQYFQPTSVSILPGRHAGLGIENYVRVTSPLRRYCDLLAHRQLLAFLDGNAVLDGEEIERRLCYSEEGAKVRRNAERDSESHWMTVYLKRLGAWSGKAVKLGEIREKSVFLLPQLGLEVRTRWGIGIEPGRELTAVLKNTDIPDCECKFDFS